MASDTADTAASGGTGDAGADRTGDATSGGTDATFGVGSALSVVTRGPALDGAVTVLSVLMVTGVVADFRRHAEGISFAEEGFLTPEHAFFYSMFLGIAGLLLSATYRERRAGADWVDAVPTGYGWGVLGVALFGFGGLGDLAWHTAFGFEQGLEGLVSPSHLTLAVGATLFLGSPLRAAWYREGRPGGVGTVPAVVSAAMVVTILALFGGFLNPLIRPYPAYPRYSTMQTGITTLTVFPLVFLGVGLALAGRFSLPPGALTVAFGVPGAASTVVEGHPLLAVPAVVAGLTADALLVLWPPTPAREHTAALRGFAVLVPVAFAGSYLTVVAATYGVSNRLIREGFRLWSPHVLGGTVALAGLAGLSLSYLLVPGLDGAPPGRAGTAPGRGGATRPAVAGDGDGTAVAGGDDRPAGEEPVRDDRPNATDGVPGGDGTPSGRDGARSDGDGGDDGSEGGDEGEPKP